MIKPLIFNGGEIKKENFNNWNIHENFFELTYSIYLKQIKNNLRIKGYEIYFGNFTLEDKRQSSYWHIAAMSKKDIRDLTPFPCKKFQYNRICDNCISRKNMITVEHKNRAKCIYRASYIQCIEQIINKINSEDYSNIEVKWIREPDESRRLQYYYNIRYNNGEEYFYIKFMYVKNKESSYLKFICGFPVFIPAKEKDLDKIFSKHTDYKPPINI